MKLGDWIKRERITHEEMARRCDVDTSTITRLISREGKSQTRKPSFRLASRIQTVTGGEVSANDFLPEAEDQATVKPADERLPAA